MKKKQKNKYLKTLIMKISTREIVMTKETFIKQEKLFKEKTGKDFTTVYKKYYSRLICYTTKISKDRKVAEDITTDTFILALEEINLYDKEKIQFSTWLFNITKKLIRNG